LHRSKFGKKGLCPQITQIHGDMKDWFEQEDAENAECSLCALRALLFQNSSSASICVNLRAIPDSVAAGRAASWRLADSAMKALSYPRNPRNPRFNSFACTWPRSTSSPSAMGHQDTQVANVQPLATIRTSSHFSIDIITY